MSILRLVFGLYEAAITLKLSITSSAGRVGGTHASVGFSPAKVQYLSLLTIPIVPTES